MVSGRNILLTLFIVVSSFINVFSQPYPPVEFNFQSGEGFQGDKLCIDLVVNNFTNVEAMQFNISYNANYVIPDCPVDLDSAPEEMEIDNSSFSCGTASDGYIRFIWLHDPITLADGTVLFTLCFNLIGDPGVLSPIYVNNLLLDIEVCQEVLNPGDKPCTDIIQANVGTIKILSDKLDVFVGYCDADIDNPSEGGSINLYGVGGTPPYVYFIDPLGFSGTLSEDGELAHVPNVPQGVYTITLRDALGNETNKVVAISRNQTMDLNPDIINPRCNGSKNGGITLNPTGGIPPYQYEWSNLVNTPSINNLGIGVHTVTVTDFTGCEKIDSFLLEVIPIEFDLSVTKPASCLGIKDGIVTISNVTGGTPYDPAGGFNYKYKLNGNQIEFLDLVNIPGISAGPLEVTVYDSAGCSTKDTIDVTYDRKVDFFVETHHDITCFGDNDGSTIIQPLPEGRYTYVPMGTILSENSGQLGGSISKFIADNLPPGTYTFTATDEDGCMGIYEFEIIEPDLIQINADIIQPDCATTGTINLNPTGGTGTINIIWSDSSLGNASTLTDLSGGTYSVTLTDANGCMKDTTIVLESTGGLVVTVESNSVTCFGDNNGSATVDILSETGSIPMFTIRWLDKDGVDLGVSTSTINNLPVGNYSVEVTPSEGCNDPIIRTFNITEPDEIIPTITVVDAACFGDNGLLSGSANGQTSGFTFEWIDKTTGIVVGTGNDFSTGAGDYILRVTDSNGCTNTAEASMNQPLEIVVPIPEVRNETCFGYADGTALILNAPAGLTFHWSSGAVGLFDHNLSAGEHWVVATDGICFSDTLFYEVFSTPRLEIDPNQLSVIDPSCFGSTDGSVTVAATGGSGSGYVYTWENGVSGPSLSNIGAGEYIVEITDSNNCKQKDTFLLLEPGILEVFLDQVNTVFLDCNNQNQGRISLGTTGGNIGVKTVTWQSGVATDGNIAVNLSPGTYCATVTDNKGCSADFCYTLTAPEPLVGKVNTPVEPLCFGGETCISVDYLTGGTGNKYTFQINNGPRYPIDSCVTVFAGHYFINLIDSAGCTIDTTIVINQPNPIEVDLGADQEIQLGLPSPVISPFVNTGSFIEDLIWSPTDYITCLDVDCSRIEVNPPVTTTYTLTVIDSDGCVGTDDIIIRVKDVRNVYFPNVFSPNSDGRNDYFQATVGPGFERMLALAIYDRWGNRVFLQENFVPDFSGTNGWDGTFNGTKLNPGVYVYHARALFIDGKEFEYSGSVTLLDSNRN